MTYSAGKFILIALFTVLLVILVNVVWWVNYQKTEQMLADQLGRRLAAAASAASVSFPPERVDSLHLGDLDAYLSASAVLENIRRSDSLSEVFILDANYVYLATTLLESDSLYFLADLHGPQIDSVLYEPDPVVRLTPTYRTGSVYLKSAFAPLYGSDGLPTAVLGVEASVDYFDSLASLRRNLYYATAVSLLAGLLLGGLFLWGQRRLNAAEERLFLGETHAHLGRMVAVVAHELRNPLMIIRGSAERLIKKTDAPEAGYLVEEVDRLNQIVTGYLDFARSGGSLLSTETASEFNLAELAGGIRKHLSEKYQGEEIQWLGAEVPPDLVMSGYYRSLRQVLLNLLFNGVEACLGAERPAAVGLDVALHAGRIEFQVRDRGAGMSRKAQRRAFTPFHTTKQAGSGLGLYLSRTLVHEMGGTITLHSTPGEGTNVTIRLPRRPKG